GFSAQSKAMMRDNILSGLWHDAARHENRCGLTARSLCGWRVFSMMGFFERGYICAAPCLDFFRTDIFNHTVHHNLRTFGWFLLGLHKTCVMAFFIRKGCVILRGGNVENIPCPAFAVFWPPYPPMRFTHEDVRRFTHKQKISFTHKCIRSRSLR